MIDYKSINAKFTPIEQDKEPEKWVELRTTGIGGSDVGAIMGLNKYASPLTVYLSKKNVEGFKGNAATEWGHILEEPIRKKAGEELGIEIISVPGMYTSNDIPYMNANLDGLCHAEHQVTIGGETVEGLGGYEIKTSSRGEGFTEDEIPDSYYCQVQHYMAVTNLPWFILTAFFLHTKKARHYIIKRNDDFIYSRIIPAEKDFWENYVLADNPPEPLGVDSENDYVANLQIDSEIELDAETEDLIAQRMELQQKIKDMEQQENALKDSILLHLSALSKNGESSSEKIIASGEHFKLSYNLQRKVSVDTEALKKSGLFDDYKKESVYRMLRISEKKQ
ncbi:MAG: YqaJ viral recombinase family protein [Methanobrevibacter sp.]|nr:YqaJ viral recombinase family protein [Methanobrevibacter sp.]